jgi:SagB-type dehydrogenase family enzyme
LEYYKRSPFLFTYWDKQNKLTVYNYNRYTKAIVSRDVTKILDVLSDWKSSEEISRKLSDFDKKILTKALRQLTKLSIVHKRPVAREESNSPSKTQWNPVELAMQRQLSYPELFPKDRNRKNPLNNTKYVRGLSSVILPRVNLNVESKRPLLDVLDERRTIRKYDYSFIDLDSLSHFLFKCARIKKIFSTQVLWGLRLTQRPYPSGGARYPLEIYPVNNKIPDIKKGIYHYNPLKHKLVLINKKETYRERLNASILRQLKPLINREPDVVFIITAVFARTMWKYKNIGLSLIMSELGCLYQTMYLVATEMNLAPCPLGGTYEELVRDWLHLNWFEESHIGTFMLGKKPKN